jgi:Fur family ferric uptake transcriptional regulator
MNLEDIKNKGIKLTKHKIAIWNLFHQYKHLDANQIYELLNKQNIHIGIATIYRILINFEKHSIVDKHFFNNEQYTYELKINNNHHDHLICIKCHHVIEFCNNEIESLQQEIANKNNFIIINHSLNIYGVCKICQQMSNNER